MGLERGGVGREGEREGEREGGAEGARMVTVGRMLGEMGATWQKDKRARKYEREREDGGRASEQVQKRGARDIATSTSSLS